MLINFILFQFSDFDKQIETELQLLRNENESLREKVNLQQLNQNTNRTSNIDSITYSSSNIELHSPTNEYLTIKSPSCLNKSRNTMNSSNSINYLIKLENKQTINQQKSFKDKANLINHQILLFSQKENKFLMKPKDFYERNYGIFYKI